MLKNAYYLQRSAPIQPKTSITLPKFWPIGRCVAAPRTACTTPRRAGRSSSGPYRAGRSLSARVPRLRSLEQVRGGEMPLRQRANAFFLTATLMFFVRVLFVVSLKLKLRLLNNTAPVHGFVVGVDPPGWSSPLLPCERTEIRTRRWNHSVSHSDIFL